MKAEIITIGTELLLGAIHDTNATYIAVELNKAGVDVMYRTTVGDNEARIASVIDAALDRVDVVLTTGGLGPTVDDVTRQGVARATGHPLEFNQVLNDEIAALFETRGYRFSDNNRRQAYIPEGAEIVRNPIGTAPTFILETDRGAVMVMPGVPREMRLLLEKEMLPWIQSHMDAPATIASRTIRTAGIGESRIDEILAELLVQTNPTVGLAAHTGQTSVRIVAKAANEKAAQVMILPTEKAIRERLGPWVYGIELETIEQAALKTAEKYGVSIAAVEVDTDDIIRRRVSATDGETSALKGFLEGYNNGTVPPEELTQQALAAARAARGGLEADYGISMVMTTDESGEIGAAMAVDWENGEYVRPFDWRFERADILEWAATHLFATLRKTILEAHGVEFVEPR